MPTPLNDNATYQAAADAAYAKRMAQGTRSPKAVIESRLSDAEAAPPEKPTSPASNIPGVQFTRPFTAEERLAQRRALARKLAERDAENAKDEK